MTCHMASALQVRDAIFYTLIAKLNITHEHKDFFSQFFSEIQMLKALHLSHPESEYITVQSYPVCTNIVIYIYAVTLYISFRSTFLTEQ